MTKFYRIKNENDGTYWSNTYGWVESGKGEQLYTKYGMKQYDLPIEGVWEEYEDVTDVYVE